MTVFWCAECKTKAYKDDDGVEYGHLNLCTKYFKYLEVKRGLFKKKRNNAGIPGRREKNLSFSFA